MQSVVCLKLVDRVWMLDVGCWILDVGCWILDVGYWMLDAGYWILDASGSHAVFRSNRI